MARGNGDGPRSEMSLRLIAESGSIGGASKFNYTDGFVVGRTRPMDGMLMHAAVAHCSNGFERNVCRFVTTRSNFSPTFSYLRVVYTMRRGSCEAGDRTG